MASTPPRTANAAAVCTIRLRRWVWLRDIVVPVGACTATGSLPFVVGPHAPVRRGLCHLLSASSRFRCHHATAGPCHENTLSQYFSGAQLPCSMISTSSPDVTGAIRDFGHTFQV